jgi:hypothetical protein
MLKITKKKKYKFLIKIKKIKVNLKLKKIKFISFPVI